MAGRAGRQLLTEDAPAAAGQASAALGDVVGQLAGLGEVSGRLVEAQRAVTGLERLHWAAIDAATDR